MNGRPAAETLQDIQSDQRFWAVDIRTQLLSPWPVGTRCSSTGEHGDSSTFRSITSTACSSTGEQGVPGNTKKCWGAFFIIFLHITRYAVANVPDNQPARNQLELQNGCYGQPGQQETALVPPQRGTGEGWRLSVLSDWK